MSTEHGGGIAFLLGPPRVYPLTHAGSDERFTEQLVKNLAALLAAHGYPPVVNTEDWAAFETALAEFLYTPDRKEVTP